MFGLEPHLSVSKGSFSPRGKFNKLRPESKLQSRSQESEIKREIEVQRLKTKSKGQRALEVQIRIISSDTIKYHSTPHRKSTIFSNHRTI